jgi:hypothetical protein
MYIRKRNKIKQLFWKCKMQGGMQHDSVKNRKIHTTSFVRLSIGKALSTMYKVLGLFPSITRK